MTDKKKKKDWINWFKFLPKNLVWWIFIKPFKPKSHYAEIQNERHLKKIAQDKAEWLLTKYTDAYNVNLKLQGENSNLHYRIMNLKLEIEKLNEKLNNRTTN